MRKGKHRIRRRSGPPEKLRGHFQFDIPRGARLTGFGTWANDQNETDFRIPHKDPRRRPPDKPDDDPEERRRR